METWFILNHFGTLGMQLVNHKNLTLINFWCKVISCRTAIFKVIAEVIIQCRFVLDQKQTNTCKHKNNNNYKMGFSKCPLHSMCSWFMFTIRDNFDSMERQLYIIYLKQYSPTLLNVYNLQRVTELQQLCKMFVW